MGAIIVGYDGSESAQRAVDRALALAGEGSTITVVGVVHMLAGKGDAPYDPIEAEDVARGLEHVAAQVREAGIDCRLVEGLGDPARVIATEASRQKADLVVVGSGHKSLVERLLFGSVSTDVLHRSPTDVLVVR
jgi:nucleotide-binding universal stress UspA family protein